MRAVIQRVLRASVTVDGAKVGAIERGLCILIGVKDDDDEYAAEYLCRKILTMRLWDDKKGRPWQMSVTDQNFGILLVSHGAAHPGRGQRCRGGERKPPPRLLFPTHFPLKWLPFC
jgi:D-tyrosyl-tRNA(Tyr) deacylase